jgi:hypothetical protein
MAQSPDHKLCFRDGGARQDGRSLAPSGGGRQGAGAKPVPLAPLCALLIFGSALAALAVAQVLWRWVVTRLMCAGEGGEHVQRRAPPRRLGLQGYAIQVE